MNTVRSYLPAASQVARRRKSLVALAWLWLGSVYATWLVARFSLGRHPRPLLDDPKNIVGAVSAIHAASVALLMPLLPLGFGVDGPGMSKLI